MRLGEAAGERKGKAGLGKSRDRIGLRGSMKTKNSSNRIKRRLKRLNSQEGSLEG